MFNKASFPVANGTFPFLSPMGDATFYLSPSPDSPTFVEVGDEVQEDTIICIIEWKKIRNEIKAETRGIILEVLAQNGKPISFGQPLFTIWPY